MNILNNFDQLTNIGLKIIPLREDTKIPVCKKWNHKWNKNINREILKKFPNCNLGLLLGEIVDVEGDSEEANKTLLRIIGDYPHPTYISSKSIHHLFLTPDKSLRHFRWNEIEFRGWGHQSVLPPSKIKDTSYKWLAASKFPIPQMPNELFGFLKDKINKKKKFNRCKPNHIKPRCINCKKFIFIHEKRFNLELGVFKILNQKWQCNKCREVDLRQACRLFRSGVDDKKIIGILNSP